MAKKKTATESTETPNILDILKDVVKDERLATGDDPLTADSSGWIDTGSYSFNALLSGSIYQGLPANQITCLAGEEQTGKTFFLLGLIKQFTESNPGSAAILFDSESAIRKEMIVQRGINPRQIGVRDVESVQDFKFRALSYLNAYLKLPEEDRQPLLLALDSLGMMSTLKEIEDSASGKDVRDMTRAQQIKAAFRVLTLKLGDAKVPMIITNHVYQLIGSYVPMKEMGGGAGAKYSASTIVFLSKRADRDTTTKEITGDIIKCTLDKSRFTRPGKTVEVLLTHSKGLHRYYGLDGLAVKYGIFKKLDKRLELPDGRKIFLSELNRNAEKYYTKEILDEIDKAAHQEFSFGIDNDDDQEIVNEDE